MPSERASLAPKVRVKAILPGAFATDVTKGWSPEQREGRYVPLGRLGEPNEIVGLALYFASSAATSRHEVVAEVGEVDDSVGAGAAVVVAGDRVAVGEEGERSTGFRVHESELARGTTVSER